jgi:hypothetical protein
MGALNTPLVTLIHRYGISCIFLSKIYLANLLYLDHGTVTRRGRYPNVVDARSVLCYWAAWELGISTLELSRRLGISQPTANQSVKRGERIVKENRPKLLG